jgi:hypothetical protein
MTYLAAWFALSLIGCAVWFLITPFIGDDDAEQQLHGAGASESTERIRAIYGLDCFRNAAEENDAAIGRLVQTIDWSE